jgi:DNA-binding CsgD family transcriptional regulator
VSAPAERYFEAGQWDEALAVLAPAAQLGPEGIPAWAHGLIALIAGHRDHHALAGEHLAAADVQQARSASPDFSPYLLLARALAAEQAARPGEAVGMLADTLNAPAGDVPHRYVLLPTLARLALAAGDAGLASAVSHAATAEAERGALPAQAAARWCRGLVNEDPGLVLDAAAFYEAAGRPLCRAQALEDVAVLLAGQVQIAAARREFADAAELYGRLGASWDLRRAESRLGGYGIRSRARARGRGARRSRPQYGWGALTPTEAKVARLVADGRSNPEIAAELFLSRNTVQTHVSHILAKLSARSRAEIIRLALGHPRSARADKRRPGR